MPEAMILGVVLIFGAIQLTSCDREHKVHNIVLYPERHSWCQTTAIKQVVASPGYESVTIDNNVCVGACYSYSIPRTQPAEPGELIGPYCDSCQPVGTRCYHVTLQAGGENAEAPKTVQKRVQIITNCSCISCDTVQNKDCEVTDQNTSELPSDLFSLLHPRGVAKQPDSSQIPTEDIPELLNFTKNISDLNYKVDAAKTNRDHKYELNRRLINLLKSIQNENINDEKSTLSYDKKELHNLLEMIEGSEHELNDKNLLEFINFVNVHNFEDLELDLSKLKNVLLTFKKDQHYKVDFGLSQAQANNENIESDIKAANLPDDFGIEGSHHGLTNIKGSHIGMGLHPVVHVNRVDTDDYKPDIEHREGKGHHHHVGEPQHVGLDVGHLVRGPHGSLAFAPDIKVEEKLNLESDMIKPNHEGVIISYENHPKSAIHK